MIAATLVCPSCGNDMVLRGTDRYRHRDGSPRMFYGCSAYPRCRSTCGAHPDGRPASSPADAETKRARIRAHEAFDRLWKRGIMTRHDAYRHLQLLMHLSKDEAHIGFFSKEQCEELIALLEKPVNQRLRTLYYVPEKGARHGPYTGFQLRLPHAE